MVFPIHISALNHLRGDKRIRFFEQEVDGEHFTIVSYMVADTDLWKLPHAKECRGITYDSTGFCVCSPFEKFFNLNENEWSQEVAIADRGDPHALFDKRDGSMLTPVLLKNGSIRFKTKKSFYSDVAKLAQAVYEQDEKLQNVVHIFLNLGFTPIFEFTHRDAEIVLNYGEEPKFTLLAARNFHTGIYMPFEEMVEYAFERVDIIQDYAPLPISRLKELCKTEENKEGWVLFWQDGLRLKMKTDWYRSLHHVKTDLRERDIAELIVDEKIDDVKSIISEMGMDLRLIEELEHRIAQEVGLIEVAVDLLLSEAKEEPDRKSIAMKHRSHPYFSLMMKAYDGKEPDFVGCWKKNFLPTYTLKCLYNPNFSGDEG